MSDLWQLRNSESQNETRAKPGSQLVTNIEALFRQDTNARGAGTRNASACPFWQLQSER